MLDVAPHENVIKIRTSVHPLQVTLIDLFFFRFYHLGSLFSFLSRSLLSRFCYRTLNLSFNLECFYIFRSCVCLQSSLLHPVKWESLMSYTSESLESRRGKLVAKPIIAFRVDIKSLSTLVMRTKIRASRSNKAEKNHVDSRDRNYHFVKIDGPLVWFRVIMISYHTNIRGHGCSRSYGTNIFICFKISDHRSINLVPFISIVEWIRLVFLV